MATKPSVVKRFKDSHHMLARMFASGMRPGEVCLAAGYSNSRVSVFLADPAFQELIAQYREAVDHTWRQGIDNYHALATANMLVAERMLSDRLEAAEDEGVLPSVRELVMISADRADRFGFAKRTTQVNLNLDFAAQLDRAIARSGVTIEGRAEPKLVETSSLHSPLGTTRPWSQPAPLPSPVVEAPSVSPAPVGAAPQREPTGAVLAFKRRF